MLITIELITDEVLSDELHVGRGAFDVYLAPLNKHHYYFFILLFAAARCSLYAATGSVHII